jgi:TonB family protein
METFVTYFLKVNIAFAALYVFYRILLHKDTFFMEKRMAFIIGFIFAILHPFINISSFIESNQPVVYVAQSIGYNLPEIYVGPESNQVSTLSIQELITGIYLIVSALLLIRIISSLVSVLIISYKSESKIINGVKVILTKKNTAPFSFFGMAYLNPNDFSENDLNEIIKHESIHIKQHHTLDVIFAEIICALFWINPFVWLLKRHIRENLEYLADNNVLKSGFDAKSYQYHLLRLSYQESTTKMVNHFNVSQLKSRIIMMNKKKTSLAGLGKYALSLPLFAFLLITAYAWSAKNNLPDAETIARVVLSPVNDLAVNTPETKDKTTEKKPEAFTAVEQMPVFPGGEEALMKYIKENLRYPQSAAKSGIQGRVIVRYVVASDGSITKVEVLRGFNEACNKEAVRVVSMMPKWIPGKQSGRNVPVYYTIPIVYKLSDEKKDNMPTNTSIAIESTSAKGIYTQVEKMPVYPGGDNALMKFILGNLKYPESAKLAGIQGRTIIRFVVDENGEVKDPVVLRGLDKACDDEAIRVIKLMPKWQPGMQSGKNVPVYFTMPIVYRLSKDEENKIYSQPDNQPYIIVDDKEFKGKMNEINPSNIESISVIKDSTATKLFGEKGKNGVVKITLKKNQ